MISASPLSCLSAGVTVGRNRSPYPKTWWNSADEPAGPRIQPPSSEPRSAARRKRLYHLQRMVWDLSFERFQGGILHKYDGIEGEDLIEATRACSLYVDQIELLIGQLEPLVFRIDGADGHNYIVEFGLGGLGYGLEAARVEASGVTLDAPDERSTATTLRKIPGHVDVARIGDVAVDRAFLIGMSMVIGLMESTGGDEDERLEPLLRMIAPTRDELRKVRERTPAPVVALDDEDAY